MDRDYWAKFIGGESAVALSSLPVGARFVFAHELDASKPCYVADPVARIKTSNRGDYRRSDNGQPFKTGPHVAVVALEAIPPFGAAPG